MLISNYRKFLFIHIYKNAGTSITAALRPFALSPWQATLNPILQKLGMKPPYNPQPYPDHIKAGEIIEQIGQVEFDQFFSFSIVRNPWDWQVSLYDFMLRKTWHPQHELVKKMSDFDEYIRWRCSEEVRLQKDFVCTKDGKLAVGYIGRFESLDDDFKRICSRIGVKAELPKLNVSSKKPYQSYYSDHTRKLVKHAFADDIEFFKYDFD